LCRKRAEGIERGRGMRAITMKKQDETGIGRVRQIYVKKDKQVQRDNGTVERE
jgi:hypothetical protein